MYRVQFDKVGKASEQVYLKRVDNINTIKKNEVLIEIICFPINPADILLVEGKYANKPKLPSLIGAECIAKVKKIGNNIRKFKLGDIVLPLVRDNWVEEKVVTENEIIKLDVDFYEKQINKINEEGKEVTKNQISNMSNIHQSFDIAKNCEDLVYFVEDDYLHKLDSIEEMIFTYEKISTQLNQELILCPSDYPYLYMNNEKTNIMIGNKRHWRTVNKTLCTFLTSKNLLNKYWDNFVKTCEDRHDPFEKYLNEIYQKEICISPLKSLSLHVTNINSSYGLAPFIDYKKLWEENDI